jgi:hypothetical protein
MFVLGVDGVFFLLLMVSFLVKKTSMRGPRTTALLRQDQHSYLSSRRHIKLIQRGIISFFGQPGGPPPFGQAASRH